jgi:DNA-binding NarL/FixJ family response regulator
MIRVLLVDDHALFRSSLRLRLEQEDGITPVGEREAPSRRSRGCACSSLTLS